MLLLCLELCTDAAYTLCVYQKTHARNSSLVLTCWHMQRQKPSPAQIPLRWLATAQIRSLLQRWLYGLWDVLQSE